MSEVAIALRPSSLFWRASTSRPACARSLLRVSCCHAAVVVRVVPAQQLALMKDCGKGTAFSTRDRSNRAAQGAAGAGASAAAWPDLDRAASKPPSTACCARGRLLVFEGAEGGAEEGGEGFAACGGRAFVRDTLRSTTASGCSAHSAICWRRAACCSSRSRSRASVGSIG